MPFRYNPITDQLDIVEINSPGGPVVGPGSSTVGDIAVFENTTGNLIGDSGININQVPTNFITNSGTAMTSTQSYGILGGIGINVSAMGNTITITNTGQAFQWNTVTSAMNPVQLIVENGYICAGSSQVQFLLPLTANLGDTFKIFSYSSTFQIIPNGSQNIVVGAVTGKIGSSGTVSSNSPGDQITLVYLGGNTFQNENVQGTMTVVYA